MNQLKFQVNLFSRLFSILPTNFKNMVSRKTRLKFGNTTELCIVDSHLICNTRTIISHTLKMQKMSTKKIDFSKILHRWTPLIWAIAILIFLLSFFYLERSKYLKKYATYEKNVCNQKNLFSEDSAKIYPTPHSQGRGLTLKFQMGTSIFYCRFVKFNRKFLSPPRCELVVGPWLGQPC